MIRTFTARPRRLAAALLLIGALAACSGNDLDRIIGRNDNNGGNNNGSNTSSSRSDAVAACVGEVNDRGWRAEPSGQNNMEVEMRVRQADGDERDVTCTYDTGRGSVSLDS
jgi:hypothetical protein